MKRISSFSIMELMVVMIITMLVIGFAYNILNFTVSRNLQFKKTKKQLHEIETILSKMEKDFVMAQLATSANDGFRCINDSINIRYTLGDSIGFKPHNQSALYFKVRSTLPNYYFNGEEQHLKDGIIDEIRFSIFIAKEEHAIILLKSYGADVLMKKENERN